MVLATILSTLLGAVPTAHAYTHPGMLHNAADFARMTTKVNAGAEPWLSGWNKLLANPHSSPNYTLQGPVPVVYRGSDGVNAQNYSKLYNDIAAAYQNALRWKIVGDTACGNKAVQILNAWGTTLTGIGGSSDRYLAAGIYGYQFANVAEIMRGYSGWSAASQTVFKNMMLNVFYPLSHDFLVNHNGACISHYWANWDACNIANIMAIGILCDDTAKFNEAVGYFKSGAGNGAYGKVAPYFYATSGGLAQCQESGRDQGHALMDVGMYGVICQMASIQGQPLFVYNPWNESRSRMQAMFEYIACYNLNNSVPYTTYANCDPVTQTVISPLGRGNLSPCWELLYAHYVQHRGLASPYIQQYVSLVRPEGGGGDYGPNSGGYDLLGFGTLTFAR